MRREDTLRVAIFHDLPSGGAKRCLFEYCRNLSRRGIVLDAYLPATANEEFLPLDETVREKRCFPASRDYLLPPGAKRGALKRLNVFIKAILDNMGGHKKIAEIINGGGYDLAFVHHSQFIQSPFVLRYLRIPSVYFMHEPYRAAHEELPQNGLDRKARFFRRFHIALFRRMDSHNAHQASMVLANSLFSHERIFDAYGIRAHVCYLGVDMDVFHPLKGVDKQDLVLSVGSLRPHKGHRFVIDSLALLPPEKRPRLVIVADSVGRGERDAVLRASREQNVEVEILIGIPDERLCLLYNQARLVAYAPYNEPFGFVPLESMACGTPVVGVREGGLLETVENGVTGFLVERDPGLFSLAVSNLLSNPDLSRQMGMQGLRVVQDRWSWEKSTDALLGCFRQVLRVGEPTDQYP